jgi:hypothetical protein
VSAAIKLAAAACHHDTSDPSAARTELAGELNPGVWPALLTHLIDGAADAAISQELLDLMTCLLNEPSCRSNQALRSWKEDACLALDVVAHEPSASARAKGTAGAALALYEDVVEDMSQAEVEALEARDTAEAAAAAGDGRGGGGGGGGEGGGGADGGGDANGSWFGGVDGAAAEDVAAARRVVSSSPPRKAVTSVAPVNTVVFNALPCSR